MHSVRFAPNDTIFRFLVNVHAASQCLITGFYGNRHPFRNDD